jgi:5'-3' exonuclease
MNVHLIDGTFELFRAYYGSPATETDDGFEIGAVRGLLRSLLALLGERGVTHVAIAFDHVIESFRNDLYLGYKTGVGIEPKLYAQFGPAEDACRALGVVTWPMIEFECDDALATAAARFAAEPGVEQVVVCSPDKDLAQCVRGTRVVCLDRIRRTTLDEDGVRAKFGVNPASIPDWLALVGDSADGFPGVPRWGAKSASAVLGVYSHLDAIPDDPRTWSVKVRGADALAASLREHRDDALLFRRLATLRTDVPLAESLDDLRWRGANFAALDGRTAAIVDEPLRRRAQALAAARNSAQPAGR